MEPATMTPYDLQRTAKPILTFSPDSDRETWLNWRRGKKISGTRAAAILGEDDRMNQCQLYDLLVHGIEPRIRTEDDDEFLTWRLSLEEPAAKRLAKQTGYVVRRTKAMESSLDPRIICSTDRRLYKDPLGRGVGTAEIKTCDPMVWRKVKNHGTPTAHLVQTQHNMMVSHDGWGLLSLADVSSGRLINVEFEADDDFQRAMWEREQEFLVRCEKEDRPTIDEPISRVNMPDIGSGQVTVVNDPSFIELIDHRTEIEYMEREVKNMKELNKEAVRQWMEENEIDVADAPGKRVFHTLISGGRRFNENLFRASHPEIDLSEFKPRGKPSRPVRFFTTRVEGIK